MTIPESDQSLAVCASCGVDKEVSWWRAVGQWLCNYCGRN